LWTFVAGGDPMGFFSLVMFFSVLWLWLFRLAVTRLFCLVLIYLLVLVVLFSCRKGAQSLNSEAMCDHEIIRGTQSGVFACE
jgi:Ca2+/Na+ antiporter